jgi:hypothetical protein
MRSPETGYSEIVYDESEVKDIQAAQAAAGGQPPDESQHYITRQELMRWLNVGRWAVTKYEAKGLLHRKLTLRRSRRKQIWYPRAECDRLSALLAERKNRQVTGPRGVCINTWAVIQEYGWSWNTLRAWEKECPCLPGGKLVPFWYSRAIGEGKPRRYYHVNDLEEIREARGRGYTGYFETPEGRWLSLKAAARQSGLSRRRLSDYTHHCPLLQEGRLRSIRRRPPDASKGKRQHTILEADLGRLLDALRNIIRDGEQGHEWQPVCAILDQHATTSLRTKVNVHRMLRAMQTNGLLSAVWLRKVYTDGLIRTAWHFNVNELARLLAGRSLEAVAEEFAKTEHNGECPAPTDSGQPKPTAAPIRRGRGRPRGRSRSTIDKRANIRKDLDSGLDTAEVAKRHHVSDGCVRNVRNGAF